MSTEHENDVIAEARELEQPQVSGSGNTMLDSLRRQRDHIGDERRTEDFDIPGYSGRLILRVRYSSDLWDRFKKIAQRVENSRNKRKELQAHADTLVLVTQAVMAVKDGDPKQLGEAFPELVPDPADREDPINFADTLLDKMFDLRRPTGEAIWEQEDRTARESLLLLFNNPLAVTNLHNQVSDWLQGNSEGDEEFLGESSAALR